MRCRPPVEKKTCTDAGVKDILWLLFVRMLRHKQKAAVRLGRIQAATLCVKGVQTARGSLLGLLGLLSAVVLLGGGFIIFHLGLLLALPWGVEARVLLLLVLGALYFLVPVAGMLYISRQQFWMQMTGVDEMVARAARGKPLKPESE